MGWTPGMEVPPEWEGMEEEYFFFKEGEYYTSVDEASESGWPWPFNMVANWLESFWDWVSEAAVNAVSVVSDWVWGAVEWVADQVSSGLGWVWDQVSGAVKGVATTLGNVWESLTTAVGNVLTTLGDALSSGLGWLWGEIKKVWDEVSSAVTGGLKFLWDSITGKLAEIWEGVTTKFGEIAQGVATWAGNLWEAVSAGLENVTAWIGDSVGALWDSLAGLAGDLLGGMAKALGEGLKWLLDSILTSLTWIGKMVFGAVNAVVDAVQGFISGLALQFMDTMTRAMTPGSPDPEIESSMKVMLESMNKRVVDEIQTMYKSPPAVGAVLGAAATVAGLLGTGIISVKVLANAADAAHPAKTIGFADIASGMVAATGASLMMSSILRAPVEVGLLTPLMHTYNEMFTPNIPGMSDLVRFAVREAFPDAVGFQQHYARMQAWAKKQGFSTYWSGAYWTAHWIIPTTSQADEMLYRREITEDEHTALYILNDVDPKYIPLLRRIRWKLPGRIDARWMYRWGEASMDDLRDSLIHDGLAPEWADRVARATARNEYLSEIGKLIVNVKSDHVKGYITEAQLRSDLADLGIPDAEIEFHIADAAADRERGHKDKQLDLIEDGWRKEMIVDFGVVEKLAGEIIVVPEALDLWLNEVYMAKYRTVTERAREE